MRFLILRLASAVPVLIGISIVSFYLLQLAPGDFLDLMVVQNPHLTPQDIARLREIYGLDQPVYVQYFHWVKGILQGDLGYSRVYAQSVSDLIRQRLPNTALLVGLSLLLSLGAAIPVGVYSAVRRHSVGDYVATLFSFLGLATPSFWLGILLILLFSVKLGWLPAGGHYGLEQGASLWGKVRYLILPCLSLSLMQTAAWTRYVRSAMLEVLQQDYIRTAVAKGLDMRTVRYRHALRNALLPLVTLVALSFPTMLGGATVTEQVFAWPGLGRLLYESVMNNDYAVAMAGFMVIAVGVVIFNFLADIAYVVIDPRIRYG